MKYKFCDQIDRQLCFNQNNIYSCTVGNNTKGQSLPIIKENYNGEMIDWVEFFKEREEIKKGFKEGHPLENCDGCFFLAEHEWDNMNTEWEFQYIQLSHWQMCNSKCIYCMNHTPYDKSKLTDTYDSVPVIQDLINKKYINEKTRVDFAGGEPTLYYRFNDLLNLFVNANIKDIIVHTNAILYNKTLENGIKAGPVSLCVSIDAGSKIVHEKVKGVKSYNKVWKNVEKYAKAKNPLKKNYISLKYIIIPGLNDTENEIEMFIQKALKAGVNLLILNADNNIFIDNIELEKNLKKVIQLSDYFVSSVRKQNIHAKLEYNVRAAYQTFKIPLPVSDINFYI